MKEMKTLNLNGEQYEIVDAEARENINNLLNSAKNLILLTDTATQEVYQLQITNGEIVILPIIIEE